MPEGSPEQIRHVVARWARRATLWGIALSVAIHLALWILAGLINVEHRIGDAGGGPLDSAVDFAVMTEVELASLAREDVSDPLPEVADSAESERMEVDIAADLAGAAPSLDADTVELEVSSGAGDVGESEIGDDAAGGGQLSGGGASFFGLEAQGKRFAYIVDRSASMRTDARMVATQQELVRSISALQQNAEFVVVLYSTTIEPLGGVSRFRKATPRNQRNAEREVAQILPDGGTYPLPAFELLFENRPLPDAIYFMTDGQIPLNTPIEVLRLNRDHGVPIHCIVFGTFDNAAVQAGILDVMKQIADQSGGRFVHLRGNTP